jgi:hypothetical protein
MARKEVNLGESTIEIMRLYAASENRSLKNYMERVLVGHANLLKERQKRVERNIKSGKP